MVAVIGQSARRREDTQLLTGRGHFIDDEKKPNMLHAAIVRSSVAHANLVSIDLEEAVATPGVIAVYTSADMRNLGGLDENCSVCQRDGSNVDIPPWPAIADTTVRYVGEPIALIIAKTADIAEMAVGLVQIDYDALEHVTNLQRSIKEDAPTIWPNITNNVALDWERGESASVDEVIQNAAHVTTVNLTQNRIVVAAMETRGVLAEYDQGKQKLTVTTPTQGVTPVHRKLVEILNLKPEQVRVISPDVGGAFGIKANIYPEQVLVAWAAMKLNQPVKWYSDRSDSFLSDYQARDHLMYGTLALDENGQFMAIRCECLSNMGAYITGPAPIIPTVGGTRLLTNVYRIPMLYARSRCALTNTVPIGAYRGAGKPEFCHLVERLVEQAASELDLPSAELRRRNLVTISDLPYRTPTGLVYDSGDFEKVMDLAIEWRTPNHPSQQTEKPKSHNKLLGRGLAVYTEPDGFKDNRVTMGFDENLQLQITTTAHTNGQGYETVFGQIATSLLGRTIGEVSFIQGDSDRVGHGSGAGGSRVTTVTSAAMHHCANDIIGQAISLASQRLQCKKSEITYDSKVGCIYHKNRRLLLTELAQTSFEEARPESVKPGFSAECHYDAPAYSYPCGAHICEVSIDIDTGHLTVVRYLHVSDFGTVVNPMLLEGQMHGGIVQGIGQALFEEAFYDDESGQFLSGSFMDYCIPRATDVPFIEYREEMTPCLTNPLGVKGCGESGCTAALPAVTNAVFNALKDYDTTTLQMPLTSERIWQVLKRPL